VRIEFLSIATAFAEICVRGRSDGIKLSLAPPNSPSRRQLGSRTFARGYAPSRVVSQRGMPPNSQVDPRGVRDSPHGLDHLADRHSAKQDPEKHEAQVRQSPDPCFPTSTLLGIGGVTRSVGTSSLGGIHGLDHISDATLRYRARSRCALREALAGNRKLTLNRSLYHILTRWASDILGTSMLKKLDLSSRLKSLIIRSIDCTRLGQVA
jgi:hypothetical protein